jgi:tRNA(fMet)-specific endonuclease VapC
VEVMLDTDVLIDVSKGKGELDPRNKYSISIITLYELIRGTSNPSLTKQLLESSFLIYPLDNPVLLKASEIYRDLKSKGKLISEADLLIGATAITYNIPLWTRNRRHFSNLLPYGLKLYRR